MVTNLRDAKSQLSKLVQLASSGEEVVITVRGRAMARLTSIPVTGEPALSREDWIKELRHAANEATEEKEKTTSQEFWDELREDRY